MFKKMMVVILAVLFLGSLGSVAVADDTAVGSPQCNCPMGCKCEHCVTGKGKCMCKSHDMGCNCPMGCKCEHCVTGKGKCMCKSGMKKSACRKCDHRTHCRTAARAEETPPNIANEKTVLSQRGMFKVSYTTDPADVPVNSIHTWRLTILTPDGVPVKNATIKVTGDMPAHGHGLPTQPKVAASSEEGTYLVEGMKFSMPGWWNISFGITVNGNSDAASFNLQL